MKIVLTYAIAWLGLVVLAILNGALREKVYAPLMSELTAHQLSTLIGIALFAVYIWILTGIYRIESSSQAVLIGSMWLAMTVSFEFIFGHFVMGDPWQKLLRDYNLLEGHVWALVLIFTAIAPYLFYRIRL